MDRQRADRILLTRHDDEQDATSSSSDDDDDGWDHADGLPRRTMSTQLHRGPLSPTLGARVRRRPLQQQQPQPRPQRDLAILSGSATPSPRKAPVPLTLRSATTTNFVSAFASMRCGAGLASGGGRAGLTAMRSLHRHVSYSAAHATYASHPTEDRYGVLSALNDGQTYTQPLCSAYSYSSRSYNSNNGGGAQWLAVGDNEGTLSLIDTSHPATATATGTDPAILRPSWRATTGSLFSLSWRFDDRFLATSGSDYSVKIWDTSSGKMVRGFHGSRGTARTIEWDPMGNGNLLASGGRDGAVHVYDLRAGKGGAVMSSGRGEDGDDDDATLDSSCEPLLSLWSAHAYSGSGKKKATAAANAAPRGVTSIAYHRHHQHSLITTGCTDARIKMWDLRFAVVGSKESLASSTVSSTLPVSSSSSQRVPFSNADVNSPLATTATTSTPRGVRRPRKATKPRKARPGSPSFVLGASFARAQDEAADSDGASALASGSSTPIPPPSSSTTDENHPIAIKPIYESSDLSTTVGRAWNARAHGISSITSGDHDSSSYTLWAACTDGRIYGVPYHLLSPSSDFDLYAQQPQEEEELTTVETLYHPSQLGNSLYNRLSLCPDGRTLALGCNLGDVLLWDVAAKTPSVLRRFVNNSAEAAARMQGGTGAHQRNCEVNSVSWCFDSGAGEGGTGRGAGWKLASAADDCVVKTWRMDRVLSGECRRWGGGGGEEEEQEGEGEEGMDEEW